METTIMGYIRIIGYVLGLYRENEIEMETKGLGFRVHKSKPTV